MNLGFYIILAARFFWLRPVCVADFNVLRTLASAEKA
jgi:hypothetical protein